MFCRRSFFFSCAAAVPGHAHASADKRASEDAARAAVAKCAQVFADTRQSFVCGQQGCGQKRACLCGGRVCGHQSEASSTARAEHMLCADTDGLQGCKK